MTASASGQSIRLFLVDGSTNGLMIATIPNWTGSVVLGRNASLPELLARPESKRPGVYILQGPDLEAPMSTRSYIGQASKLSDRLSQQARDKDFWDIVAMISTSDPNFSAGHFFALESRLIRQAREAGRVIVDNTVDPSEDAGVLGEADRADVDNFQTQLELVLPVLGLSLLRPQPKPSSQAREITPAQTFVLKRRDGLVARAQEIEDEFVVLKGSQALQSPGFAINQYSRQRERPVTENKLVPDSNTEFLIFVDDIGFPSPSQAAAVVLDRNANGRTEWKVEGGSQTYHEWQEAAAAEQGQVT